MVTLELKIESAVTIELFMWIMDVRSRLLAQKFVVQPRLASSTDDTPNGPNPVCSQYQPRFIHSTEHCIDGVVEWAQHNVKYMSLVRSKAVGGETLRLSFDVGLDDGSFPMLKA